MKFSQVIGRAYHKIGLTQEWRNLLDVYFTASAHHLFRYKESGLNSASEIFHDYLFRSHLREMMRVIYEHGDFSRAVDPTGFDLHLRRSWNPGLSNYQLPDPKMYGAMYPDWRFGVGEPHPSDVYLRQIFTPSSNIQCSITITSSASG